MELLKITKQITDSLEKIGIHCRIVGSVASSRLGAVRATLDVDIVADIKAEVVERWLEPLKTEFYADSEQIIKAIENKISFNLIHLETMLKVDIFPLRNRAYDQMAFSRVVFDELPFMSAEDVLLGKLEWYKATDCTSQRQWSDILGILRVTKDLDLIYTRHWASEIDVLDLLDTALLETGTV